MGATKVSAVHSLVELLELHNEEPPNSEKLIVTVLVTVERRYSRWVCVRNVIASGCPRIHGIPGVVHITVVLPYMTVRSREQGAEASLK